MTHRLNIAASHALEQRCIPAGKIVMAWGIAWFSLSSMLLPVAFSAKVRQG